MGLVAAAARGDSAGGRPQEAPLLPLTTTERLRFREAGLTSHRGGHCSFAEPPYRSAIPLFS